MKTNVYSQWVFCLVFSFKKPIDLSLFIKFVLQSKTNKDKSTEIGSPLLPKPTDICAHAMPTILKKTTGLCPFRSYYSMRQMNGMSATLSYEYCTIHSLLKFKRLIKTGPTFLPPDRPGRWRLSGTAPVGQLGYTREYLVVSMYSYIKFSLSRGL